MTLFSDFYEETRISFFNYLLKLSGDYDCASDIMQEAYLRYYKKYTPPFKKQILYKIAYNLFVDIYRKSKKNVSLDEINKEIISYNNLPDKDHEYNSVIGMLDKLNDDERNILSMVISEGLSYNEISDITGLSIANVKIKIHRARKKLKNMFGDKK